MGLVRFYHCAVTFFILRAQAKWWVASDEVDYAALAARLSVREVLETRKLLEVDQSEASGKSPSGRALHRARRRLANGKQ